MKTQRRSLLAWAIGLRIGEDELKLSLPFWTVSEFRPAFALFRYKFRLNFSPLCL
ncbi:hypothetical protein [Leptolyngbya sp. FACHB-711]|uniref:hypothetical protein n=1 Tax=Leptolyngbya sp. FACHB-711 TaxID=2692813 RepID=UPI001A7E96BA|nr:hypothetical protein [Leptolyngbya sp. FACHB-711]